MEAVKVSALTFEQINQIVHLAWSDRISFEAIEERTGLPEAAVIKLMRGHLKRKSFQIWRQRVSGRSTKHRKRFREERQKLRSAAHSA